MRYVLTLTVAASLFLAGCPKQEPKVSEPAAPVKPVNELKPIDSTGPMPTPMPTPKPIPPDDVSKPVAKGTYTVVKGDTLFSIAKTNLGNGNRWPEIVKLNPGLKPETLKVGQTIKLPEK